MNIEDPDLVEVFKELFYGLRKPDYDYNNQMSSTDVFELKNHVVKFHYFSDFDFVSVEDKGA